MTRKELIRNLKYTMKKHEDDTVSTFGTNISLMCKDVLDYLEQEPCEDEYIKVPKKALKYRTAGMVAYNVEWLKNHFDIELAVICGTQESCGDTVSRQAVIDMAGLSDWFDSSDSYNEFVIALSKLPPVNPQEPKTGHWKRTSIDLYVQHATAYYQCSECGEKVIGEHNYCQFCGARMESEE